MPYSGPSLRIRRARKGEVGYFKMLDERGGINGRKINLISLDDSYQPAEDGRAEHGGWSRATRWR